MSGPNSDSPRQPPSPLDKKTGQKRLLPIVKTWNKTKNPVCEKKARPKGSGRLGNDERGADSTPKNLESPSPEIARVDERRANHGDYVRPRVVCHRSFVTTESKKRQKRPLHRFLPSKKKDGKKREYGLSAKKHKTRRTNSYEFKTESHRVTTNSMRALKRPPNKSEKGRHRTHFLLDRKATFEKKRLSLTTCPNDAVYT